KTALNKTYADVKAGKITKEEAKSSNLSKIDDLIDKAKDADERESLRDVKTIIQQEAGEDVKTLKEEVKSLRDDIKFLKTNSLRNIEDKVLDSIDNLEKEFGKEMVDKYRKQLETKAYKFPSSDIESIFLITASKADRDLAILTRAKRLEKLELKRKKDGSSIGGDDTITPKSKYVKDKAGKVTTDSIIQRVRERMGK
ncbi:hypothetical protein LCGC14_2297050, partial [marine sediment metagenome]